MMRETPRGPGNRRSLSVVVPVYNEKEVLPEFHRRVCAVLATLDMHCRIIYVNDGSTDGSLEVIDALDAQEARVQLVDLSRNFGKEIALTAGLDHADTRRRRRHRRRLAGPAGTDPGTGRALAGRLRRGLRQAYPARWRRRVQAGHGLPVLPRDTEVEPGRDSGGHGRFPPAEPACGRRHQTVARAAPLHEGPVCLDRLPAKSRALPARGALRRHHQMELLEAVEFRARRHHLVYRRPAEDRHLCRPGQRHWPRSRTAPISPCAPSCMAIPFPAIPRWW